MRPPPPALNGRKRVLWKARRGRALVSLFFKASRYDALAKRYAHLRSEHEKLRAQLERRKAE